MGQEFGAASEKSLEPRPLDWSLLRNERNAALRAHVKTLFALRGSPALQNDSFEICLKDPSRRVFAFKRWNAEGNVVVVAANLRHETAGEITVQSCGLEDGIWHEHTCGYDREVKDGVLVDELGPSELKIFVKK